MAIVSLVEQPAVCRNLRRFDTEEAGSNGTVQSTDPTVSVCTVAPQDGRSCMQRFRFALNRMRDTEGTVSLRSVVVMRDGAILRIQTY